ncbi:MAG: MBL fold metallo-hydrolase [Bacillota bacterium]
MKFRKLKEGAYFLTIEKDISSLDEEMYFYLKVSDKKIILTDTHLGKKSMEPIIDFIKKNSWENKEIIIFNSHSDWDHIWGNCAFKDPKIISHRLCKERIEKVGENILKQKSCYKMGEVEIVKPNIIFNNEYELKDEKIILKHTPSHTKDSACLYDYDKNIIYVGDILEKPIPFIRTKDLDKYIEVLRWIKNLEVDKIITAHSGIVKKELVDKTIEYIKNLKSNKDMIFKDELKNSYHKSNLEFLQKK